MPASGKPFAALQAAPVERRAIALKPPIRPTAASGPADEPRPVLDPAVGLPLEDVDSPFLDDAEHWLAVYDELLTVKRLLLDRADEALKGVSDDALREANVDQRLLRAQAERYEVRRSYWVRRAEELLALGSPHDPASEEPA